MEHLENNDNSRMKWIVCCGVCRSRSGVCRLPSGYCSHAWFTSLGCTVLCLPVHCWCW